MKLWLATFSLVVLVACKDESPSEQEQTSHDLTQSTNYQYNHIINRIAREERVDPKLIHAVIKQESGYNPSAQSSAGAVGLMQLMPATAADYGLASHERFDPVKNIRVGTQHLKKLLKLFNGNLSLALAGYNAGQGNVIKYGYKIPPFAETQNYVRRVRNNYLTAQRTEFEHYQANTALLVSSLDVEETHAL